MKRPESVSLAFAKADISKTHINDLNQKIERFFESNPYSITSDVDVFGVQETWKFVLPEKVPYEIIVAVGDIMHKLRSALDNMACSIAIKYSGSSDDTYFPIGNSRVGLEQQIAGKAKKLPDCAVDIIRSLDPYKGGNDLLWLLHDSNRNDKHPALEVFNVRTLTKFKGVRELSGKIQIVGNRNGRHFRKVDGALIQPDPDKTPVYRDRNGERYIEFFDDGLDDNLEFLSAIPGTRFRADFKPSLSISFSRIDGFQRRPVVEVLSEMSDLVQDILSTFDHHFFS